MPALRSVEVHFNQGVTGVAAADLLINNVPATNVTAYAPWQYVFDFPEPPMGDVQVSWATNANLVSLAGQTNVSPGGRLELHAGPVGAAAEPGNLRVHGR